MGIDMNRFAHLELKSAIEHGLNEAHGTNGEERDPSRYEIKEAIYQDIKFFFFNNSRNLERITKALNGDHACICDKCLEKARETVRIVIGGDL